MSDVVRRVLRDGSFRRCAEAYARKRTMRGVEYAKERWYVRHWICKAAAEIVWRRICKVVEVSGRDTWRWEWSWLLGVADDEDGPPDVAGKTGMEAVHARVWGMLIRRRLGRLPAGRRVAGCGGVW